MYYNPYLTLPILRHILIHIFTEISCYFVLIGYEAPKTSPSMIQWQRDDALTIQRHSEFAEVLVSAPAVQEARAEARRTLWRRELDATVL
jgi:hypothetical protein